MLMSVPGSAQAVTVVYPTGEYPADVENVQAAVDQGGTVLLKATNAVGDPTSFNFGPPVSGSGTVFPATDVTVEGETVAGDTTTVTGGDAPFQVYDAIELRIRGVSFVGPRGAAVFTLITGGLEFSRSSVAHVTPIHWYDDPDTGEAIYKGQCLWVQALGPSSGSIAIEDNTFDDCGLNGAQLGYGLALVPALNRLTVARNVIRGANLAGVILIWPGAETVIEDNTIEPGPADVADDWGNGIHLLGAWERVQNAPITMRDNDIAVEGQNAHGIWAFGDTVFNYGVQHTALDGNRIAVRGGSAAIGFYGLVSDSRALHNQVRGDSQFALTLGQGYFDPSDQAVRNLFVGNNIATFDASIADVLFDEHTIGNDLMGHSGTVIDLGTDNRITGYTEPLSKAAAQVMRTRRAAAAQRLALPDAPHR